MAKSTLPAAQLVPALATTRSLPQELSRAEATFASGSHTSSVVEMRGHTIKRIHLPSNLLGAKLIVLHGLEAGGTFHPAQDTTGELIAMPFVAGRCIELDERQCNASLFVKFQTVETDGTTPTTQAGSRLITVVAIP
jgi:hypothetical protein